MLYNYITLHGVKKKKSSFVIKIRKLMVHKMDKHGRDDKYKQNFAMKVELKRSSVTYRRKGNFSIGIEYKGLYVIYVICRGLFGVLTCHILRKTNKM
jgi:hypothetical protein